MATTEILLYTSIYGDTAELLIDKMGQVDVTNDITIRMNCSGGSIFAGWGIVAKMNEIQTQGRKVFVKVDGQASSMAAYIALFADKVECLDVSTFLIHRADGYVQSEDDKMFLAQKNKELRAALEKRVDCKKLSEIMKCSLDDLFSLDARKDVYLTAKQAKEIGLVSKINRLEPKEIAALNERFVAFSNFEPQGSEVKSQGSEEKSTTDSNNLNNKKMTKEQIKADHPEIYASIQKEGMDSERMRIKAHLNFIDVDKDATIKAINEGEEMNSEVMARMTVKIAAKAQVKKLETDTEKEITTKKVETEKTDKEKEVDAFAKELKELRKN
jgi:ATP-dependent protease ClpP protease subunit